MLWSASRLVIVFATSTSLYSRRFRLCGYSTPKPTIGSGDGDCAPAPSHTTGRTVFRIRRLDPAAFPTRRKTGRLPESTASRASCIAFCQDRRDTHPGSHRPRPATAPPLLLRPAPRFVPLRRGRTLRPGTPGNLSGVVSVAPLALLLGPSALRSSGVTRLPRYYGLC